MVPCMQLAWRRHLPPAVSLQAGRELWLCVQVDVCAMSLEALFVVLRLVFQPGGWAWWDLAFLALKNFTISAALLARTW